MAEQTTKDDALNPSNPDPGSETSANETTHPEVKPPADPEKPDPGKGASVAKGDPASDGNKGMGKPKRSYKRREAKADAAGQGATTGTTPTAAKELTDPIEISITTEWSRILKKAQDKILEETNIPMPFSKLNEWACSESQLDDKAATYCRIIREKHL